MNTLSETQQTELLDILKTRFEQNQARHIGLTWAAVHARIIANPEKLWSLYEMERTGGEPDVVVFDDFDNINNFNNFNNENGAYIFCDCAPESPNGRRSLCYDRAAWEMRKTNKPMR